LLKILYISAIKKYYLYLCKMAGLGEPSALVP